MKGMHFWQGIFLSLALTLLFIFSTSLVMWHNLEEPQQLVLRQALYDNTYYVLALITVVPVALWVVFEICYTRFYLPLKKMPAEIAVMAGTNSSHRLDFSGNRNIRELSEAINGFAEMHERLTRNIAEEIGAAKRETEKERNILASIMAELSVGIIICNINGRILLFNSQARRPFTTHSRGRSEYFLGLGRSIYHIIDGALIGHALEEIEERLHAGKNRVASYFTTQIGEQILLVETIPVLSQERQVTGFILTLQDISENIESSDIINRSMLAFGGDLHRRCGQIEELLEGGDLGGGPTGKKMRQLLLALEREYDDMRRTVLDAAFETMPLSRLNLMSFLFRVQKTAGSEKNIRLNVTVTSREKRLLGDGFSFAAAFVFLLEQLAVLTAREEFDLVVAVEEKQILFDISWGDMRIDRREVEGLLKRRIPPLTSLGYVLKQNCASLQALPEKLADCSGVRIAARAEPALPLASRRRSPVIAGSRPEYFDFNLFSAAESHGDVLDARLIDLTYSVIDTETTGLDPEGGDEIIAIGAVRIVGNRIIHGDSFEQLINPERDIPVESYRVHGIEKDMVAEKPTITEVLPVFQRYLSDTVIVGHDVGFDLKMLKMKEKDTGVVLANPVLDTLLLSAMLHPIHKQHNIESIAKRLGVSIVGRHTALGDAAATAEIFLRLLPILQSKGIYTLKQAIEASRRTFFSRLRY